MWTNTGISSLFIWCLCFFDSIVFTFKSRAKKVLNLDKWQTSQFHEDCPFYKTKIISVFKFEREDLVLLYFNRFVLERVWWEHGWALEHKIPVFNISQNKTPKSLRTSIFLSSDCTEYLNFNIIVLIFRVNS
jgi:hypothetical protein